MFGSLLGTLAKFRQEESSQKEKVGLKKKMLSTDTFPWWF